MTVLGTTANFSQELVLLLGEASLRGAEHLTYHPDRRYFGYFCSYFPEELIMAAGFTPLRLLPNSPNATPAELPTYCCSLARGVLNMENNKEWKTLAGIGFAHTCDTMQCLSGVWAASSRSATLDIVPPVMLTAKGANGYYLAEFGQLLLEFSKLVKHDLALHLVSDAIKICSQTRRLAAELDELRPYLPSHLVSALLRAGQVMPKDEYNTALEAALPMLTELSSQPDSRIRLLVSGAVLEHDSLFQTIEELGGRVVADDTCTGYRHYAGNTYWSEEHPLQDLVRRYTELPPCPSKSQGLNERLDYLLTLAKQRSAQGAILVIRKYCDPHAWDAVVLIENFKQSGLRILVLELEGAIVGGQERTRLQAFLESLTC